MYKIYIIKDYVDVALLIHQQQFSDPKSGYDLEQLLINVDIFFDFIMNPDEHFS